MSNKFLDKKHLQQYLDEFCFRLSCCWFSGELFNHIDMFGEDSTGIDISFQVFASSRLEGNEWEDGIEKIKKKLEIDGVYIPKHL